MKPGYRCRLRIKFLAVIGCFTVINFVSRFLNTRTSCVKMHSSCLYESSIKFNGSGVIDTSSEWRKLGQARYLFTAYLDDREPCSTVITVFGFGVKSESSLYATLLFDNDTRICLGKYDERKILNPYGSYNLKRLGPYAYSWTLPAIIVNASHLKSIVIQQIHPPKGITNKTTTSEPKV